MTTCTYCGQHQPAEKPCPQCLTPERLAQADVAVMAAWQDPTQPATFVEAMSCADLARGIAREYARNVDYYRGLLDKIAECIGPPAYTCDDGSMSEEPLRAKLPEMVAALATDGDPTEDSRPFPVRSCVKCGKEYNTVVCITCEGGVIPSGDIRNRGPSWLQNRTCIKCGEKYNGAIATSSGIDSHMCSKCATGRALFGLPEDEPK